MGQESGFTRTPKLGVEKNKQSVAKKRYRGKSKGYLPWVELGFGAYLTLAVWFALDNEISVLAAVPGAVPGRVPLRGPDEPAPGPLRRLG